MDREKAFSLLNILERSELNLLRFGYFECGREWRISERRIEDYMFFYIFEGEGHFILDRERRVPVSAGDLLFVSPGEPHAAEHYEGRFLRCVTVHFFMNLFSGADVFSMARVDSLMRFPRFRFFFELIRDEIRGDSELKALKIKEILKLILFEVFENFATFSMAEFAADAKFRLLADFMEHVRDNLNERILLSEFCAHQGASSTTLESAAKKYTGKTPTAIIADEKMEFAKKLLLSGISVSECAERTGYSDVYYFSRAFKKTVGVSPTNYKNTL